MQKNKSGTSLNTSPRFLIDTSAYLINNNGDMALLKTLLQRLRSHYAEALIRIITNDPDGVTALDPQVKPVIVGDRSLWQITRALGIPSDDSFQLDSWLSHAHPEEYQSLLAEINPAAGEARQGWEQALDDSDVVFLMGGGYFTDAFAEHAVHLLTTLAEASRRNQLTFIVGCGFEPITEPRLQQFAGDVLPRVTMIACREALTSPGVLRSFNVAPEQFTITGDDAIELAYAARPAALGDRIGVSLRDHVYNPIEAGQYQTLRNVIQTFAADKQAELQPAPISNYLPSDMEAIRRILPGIDNANSGGSALNTPEHLLIEIAHCRIMIAGGYHAAVFALSMGIPSICLTSSSHYRHKMSGLLSMFGTNPESRVIAMDDTRLAEKLNAAMNDAWANADAERPRLLAAAKTQIEHGLAAYAQIFDKIDTARLNPHPEQSAATASSASAESRATLAVLRALAQQIKQLSSERDYLQFHADERLKIIENLLEKQNTQEASPRFKKRWRRFL